MVKGIIFPELCMAEPMELTLYPWGAQGGGEALVGRGLHCSSNGGEPGLGELLPSAPPRDFLLLAFWDLGFSLASSVLQDLTFSGCCRLIPCSSQISAAPPVHQICADLSAPAAPTTLLQQHSLPCNVGKMPISSVFCPKPSHAGGLGHPEVHTEVAGCFKPTCKWNGAAAEPGFSFPSHLLAWLPEGSAFLRSPLHGFRGLCSTHWRGGVKKIKIKYCKRGSKGF